MYGTVWYERCYKDTKEKCCSERSAVTKGKVLFWEERWCYRRRDAATKGEVLLKVKYCYERRGVVTK